MEILSPEISDFKQIIYAKHRITFIDSKYIVNYDITFKNPLNEDGFLDIFAYIKSLGVTPMIFHGGLEVDHDNIYNFIGEKSFSVNEDTFFALTKYMKFEKIKELLCEKAKNTRNKTKDNVCFLLK
nr:hypothetical protein [Candidatus Gracilibacteria bacterium]